ncbi:MAG: ComEC/Rec2 family competence protein [Clostridia bacterium]|nr:ComEC/Rec2 family competence protein [Clostridia bacterium]
MNNKRIVNVRILFVALIGIISGILCGYLTIKCINLNYFSLYLIPIIVLLAFSLCCLFLKIFKSNNKYINVINRHFVATIAFVLLFVIGFGFTTIKLVNYTKLNDFDGTYNITLTAQKVRAYDNYATINASKFYIDSRIVNESISVRVYFNDNSTFDIKDGDVLSFDGSVKLQPLFDDTSNLVDYLYGKIYSTQINLSNITKIDSKTYIDDAVRNRVYSVLQDNMSEDNAGIAYAMLFGDKEHLDSQNMQMFSYAGVAHILAVSGLHVTMLAGIIAWILKRIKVKRVVNLVVVSVFLLIYCYLCGFAPSVVRASIMSVIMLIAYVTGKEYDVLSSLSLAAILTLLVNPLNLFATGFQLYYLCLLSIITLSNSISRILAKLKLPKIVCSTIAISTCINLVILAISANTFGKVSLIGMLTNVFVLPLFSVAFPLLFGCVFIVSIFRFMGFMLFIPNVMLHLIKLIANFFANLNVLNFNFYHISYVVLILIILILLIIKYLMIKQLYKSIICSALAVLMVVSFSVSMISNSYNDVFALSYQYKSNSAVITIEGKNCLIGTQDKYISTMLKELKIRKIDYIIGYDVTSNNLDVIDSMCKDYKVNKVFVPSTYSSLKPDYVALDTFDLGNCHFEYQYNSYDKCVGLKIEHNDKIIVFVSSNNTTQDNVVLINNLMHIDYLVANRLSVNTSLLNDVENIILYNGSSEYNYLDLYNVQKYELRV